MSETEEITNAEEVGIGKFKESLLRNNDKIKKDRADSIFEDAETRYRRKIEDYIQSYKNLIRNRENALDLSPTDANSLVLNKDFNSMEYVNEDMRITIELYNLKIKIDLAIERYKYLFGKNEIFEKITESI